MRIILKSEQKIYKNLAQIFLISIVKAKVSPLFRKGMRFAGQWCMTPAGCGRLPAVHTRLEKDKMQRVRKTQQK